MKKRILSILLTVAMVVTMLPMAAFAQEGTSAVCDCTVLCTEEAVNNDCPVCLAEGGFENCEFVEAAITLLQTDRHLTPCTDESESHAYLLTLLDTEGGTTLLSDEQAETLEAHLAICVFLFG